MAGNEVCVFSVRALSCDTHLDQSRDLTGNFDATLLLGQLPL